MRRRGYTRTMPRLVRVAVPVPLPRLFDYRLEDGAAMPAVGCRVRVPFSGRERVGIVLACDPQSELADDQLKPVSEILDTQPLLTSELIETLEWASRYYQHAVGEVFDSALPTLLRSGRDLPQAGIAGITLGALGQQQRIDAPPRSGTRVSALVERLHGGPVATAELDQELPGWRSSARSLRSRGWLEDCRLPEIALSDRPLAAPALNDEQQVAVDAVIGSVGKFSPFLLDGVTGSGKTEVYLAAIGEVIRQGRQALVLVPEIALTPQTTRRFRERLGFDVAILHSGLSERERAVAWLSAARGEARVVLGTRSAIFVPMPRSGLIVVDEEHDISYKQQDGFRYHARDLAVLRAKSLGVPLMLGSATPSLESLANVESGRYRSLRLSRRAGVARPPSLEIMDLRNKRLDQGLAISSLKAIEACVGRGEQALVFRNRRGYAPVLFCHACGWSAQCQRCDRPLTLHRGAGRLRCHHCAAEARVPATCPECASTALAPQGQGTERLEEVLQQRFPGTPIVRVDRDSTRSRSGREEILEGLDVPGPRILVGTQMLAKGHDLANLTLVVVTGVDQGLYSVDFRAGERLGQLIVQVAGRAGRADRPGAVILQTHHPEHPLLHALIGGGYAALSSGLLNERRLAGLPPFATFSLLRAEAREQADTNAFLQLAAESARVSGHAIVAHGPLPAPMPRRAGYQRSQVLIESENRGLMQAFLPAWIESLRNVPAARKVRWSIDVDPVEMG